jgi:hypothetical protein
MCPSPSVLLSALGAAYENAHDRLSIVETELIALAVSGVANSCKVGPIPAEKGIEEACFLSQPSLVFLPGACPLSQSLAPFNACSKRIG